MYRITEEEMQASQREYKKSYPPFVPFNPDDRVRTGLENRFYNLITTQNGSDTDDYCIDDNNKVEKFMGDVPKGSEVLILGVGTGREILVAKDMGFNAVGTTLGSRNIHYGINYLGLKENELIECTNEVLPFKAETFDMVAGFQIFEHTLAPLLFLLEQSRVLKMGGKLFLEWPPAEGHTMDKNPHHQVCFTSGQAYGLFRKACFGDIKLYYDDLTPIPEEEWWRGDIKKTMCIEGVKVGTGYDYVRRAWSVY